MKFRGAFPYPVVLKKIAIFLKERILMIKFRVRKCIELAVNLESRNDLLMDIDNKLNRIIYRENVQNYVLNNLTFS